MCDSCFRASGEREQGIEVKRWRNWGMGEMHKRVKRQESAAEILLDTKYLPDDVLYRGYFGTFSLLEVTRFGRRLSLYPVLSQYEGSGFITSEPCGKRSQGLLQHIQCRLKRNYYYQSTSLHCLRITGTLDKMHITVSPRNESETRSRICPSVR